MPHISRHVPEKEVADKIYDALLTHLTSGGVKNRLLLISELLTRVEQVMLAKRLAIICMLGEGYSFEDIQETLRVSPSTVGRIWSMMRKGTYRNTARIVKRTKVSDALLGILAAIISGPRPRHAPRWKWLDEL